MYISFEDDEVMDSCLSLELAEERFGRTYAAQLVTMISDAEAFDHVADWHDILGDDVMIVGPESFSVDIASKYTATFVSVDRHHRVDGDGRIDWASVEFIKLVTISERP